MTGNEQRLDEAFAKGRSGRATTGQLGHRCERAAWPAMEGRGARTGA
jgi:hypothetical protein